MSILFLVVILAIAWYTSQLAEQKGRSPLLWFILGMFFGIFALIAIYLLPPVAKTSAPVGNGTTIEVEPVVVETSPAYETATWFYLDKERRQQGPFSYQELKNLWTARTLSVQTFVWSSGMGDWKRIGDLPELVDSFTN